ncbi:fimbrial protein [Cronobacter malonaticus]|uniref:Pilus assembly protein n=2 Tax=Cronobacter malonaticus TaxID=413503 RepID=A0A423XZM7_9ENTR|nr:fimbrial protein [Cronobacter malonaticus]CCJ94199.1 Putative minor fimbrial subunit [Cronobacter malonaticus 681]CCJ99591.1 Putative minor fimbrial subunit [Cronobacter malonaticus 507]ALX77189.1 pilus assembly protein [Cronobacter malonaticus LMG 23826]EGT4278995.1 pilus assembly protein [Cronobacter malonaticus]EGT4288354.1 pilus assembly protein [Cronobacter malonaticus]
MKMLIKILGLTVLLPACALCAENMSFHGTLVAPPCKISNGQTIEVTFGNDLGVNKIDGNNYKQPINYTIDCDAGYTANNLAIVVDTTNPALFDSAAVMTDKTGLGIRILVDSQPVTFSQHVAVINPASPPKIEAVPVQDQSITLTEGAFEATMTLRADYL